MKYVIVVSEGKFKVMYNDGTQLHQSREYGKDCVFEGIRAAAACRKRLMRF